MSDTYDPDQNSERSYALWLKAAREIRIRSRLTLPDPNKPDEVRWSVEGARAISQLDAVLEAARE